MAALPTDTPAPTETPSPTETPELTPTSELTPTDTPELPTETPSPEATFTPAVTETPLPTVEPSATPTPETQAALRAVIAAPVDGAQVTGQVEVMGSADGAGFVGYALEYAPGDQPGETDWLPVAPPSAEPVSDGLLALWPTDALNTGVYSLRLRALNSSGDVRTAQVRVIVVR
jgi:hypothetical protein